MMTVQTARSLRRSVAGAVVVISIAAIAAMPGIAGAAGQTGRPAKTSPWVTYNVSGVAFQHPSSWTVQHAAAGPLYVYIDPAGVPFRRNINLILQQAAHPLTLVGFLKLSKGQIVKDHGTISQQSAVSFDRAPGYRMEWLAKFGGNSLEFLSQWTVRRGDVWLVTYTADRRRFASALPDVKRLLASMTVPG
jgi:hypothetical protein